MIFWEFRTITQILSTVWNNANPAVVAYYLNQLMNLSIFLGSVFGSNSARMSGIQTSDSGSADSGWVRGSDGQWTRKTSSWSSWSSGSGSSYGSSGSSGGSGGASYGGSGGGGGSYGYKREHGTEGHAAGGGGQRGTNVAAGAEETRLGGGVAGVAQRNEAEGLREAQEGGEGRYRGTGTG